MVGSLCNSAASITHCCNILPGLFVCSSEIIPGQIPLSAFGVVTPVQRRQLPHPALEMFYLSVLHLTPEIPVAERRGNVKTRFLGLLFVCMLRLRGFRGGWRAQPLAGRSPGAVQTGRERTKRVCAVLPFSKVHLVAWSEEDLSASCWGRGAS